MSGAAYGLKINYVKPREDVSEEENRNRLLRFITLFSQVGFREISLNPETNIKLDCCK